MRVECELCGDVSDYPDAAVTGALTYLRKQSLDRGASGRVLMLCQRCADLMPDRDDVHAEVRMRK
jgi:hypothetical protein